jgi:tetratricopeptide (TPR) repeat protein
VLALSTISLVCKWQIRKRPHLIVGWSWYLITLLPVIGIVQVGQQARADRYTYIPLIGIFIMLAWEAGRITERWRAGQTVIISAFATIFVILSLLTWRQAGYWKDGITLFGHAVEVTDNNWLAEHNLGVAFMNKRRNREALYHFQEALRIKPDYTYAYLNLGRLLGNMGDLEGAIRAFNSALAIDPGNADARQELGRVYEYMRRH